MNKSIIVYILGWILIIEAAFMLPSCIVALIYSEPEGWWFLLVLALAAIAGFLLSHKKPKNTVFYLKEGCIATALGWILLSLVGCLPLWLSGAIPNFTDALFEIVSGFTTTGSSILTDIEALPYCCLFWRSFSHWIGGMGVLVFLLAIVSMTGGSHMNLMKAESPGPSVGKLVPKVKHTARILYLIYIGMTVIMILMLILGDMSLFESLCTAFGAAGTGGFGIRSDSCTSYSPYIQWVITVFMILFGVNFNFYYFLLFKKWRQAVKMEEVRWYIIIILAAVALIMFNSGISDMGFSDTLRHVFFQVGSIITTTGFATVDFDLWPDLSRCLLVLLMFIGACAGSTGGGLKVSRVITLVKSGISELQAYIHPKSVRRIRLDGRAADSTMVSSIATYFIVYILIFIVSTLAVSADNFGFATSFTAVAATLNNIGPGLELVGPTQNFFMFSPLTKYVLIFDMLAGRLELFPMLLLLHPAVWKDAFSRSKKRSA